MRKVDPRLVWAIVASGLVMALWLVLMSVIVWSTLSPDERMAVGDVLAQRTALVAVGWLIGLGLVAGVLRVLHRRYVGAPYQLLEETRVVLAATTPQKLKPRGTAEMQALASAVNELAAQRDQLRGDMTEQVAQASVRVQQEKDRLAALMAELNQSVVVCNRDGRILLYNQRARQQFRALSQEPGLADGTELVGIGRSIYAVFDRQLLAHALERIHQSMVRGVASPSAQFVTTTQGGQLLRVQVAPVRSGGSDAGAGDAAQAVVSGFVLMLNNVTASVEEEAARDQLLHGLTEGSRASLANIQAAVDMLGYSDLEPAMRERFLGVVRDEVGAMGRRITDLAQRATQRLKTRWPMEDMLGADLAAAAQRQIAAHCTCPVTLDAVDTSLWLKVDSYTLLQALTYLAHRLVDEFEVRFLQLRLQAAGAHAQLDLVWSGQAMSNETVMSWEMDSMYFGNERSPLTVRDVIERHGGEMWFERERVRHQAFFRFMLPLASVQGVVDAELGESDCSRPEYYDFDLFQMAEQGSALDDRPLSELAYTVFDTETTGLNPSEGDAIIQIGAARIVNGKLLRQECFEQLVNPGRGIPAASIPIHGITEDMVVGKPRIGEVLPVFHAFAQDTVLVAHNAAFDMRFLQLQEEATGIAFHQPVLDTLLLSAVVHPHQDSHRLEAIAERFNVTVLGRHTALGDALVTAEIWLRLIPLLQAQGIHTLRQAREAAQKTYYARLKY
ncbi:MULTISPECIES: exonuclease domain-containing protein [unclassified Simplicispira]|uniref:3'-5' exonuclease n=1 Tax=unclassified Simplicispira TaxID=2630407 RepID=UPI000D5D68B3|nr:MULTISPECIES: exonuclease domain-containing protein [unclassified Simplicispira]PVY56899.1 DNA polymerase-3 subunit epsilon [Simplicispira sp. 125]REG17844.1 DNA polymerase-3 subunit epsilon [Simplicispira sp. 110]